MAVGERRRFFADEEARLIAWAEPRIRAAVGGVNEGAHLAVARKYGMGPRDDTGPSDPGVFRHVWLWFFELCETRQIEGMSGLHQPLAYAEVLAWSELNHQPIASHELRLLRALDRIFIREERKAKAEKSKEQAAKAKTKKGGR